MTIQITKNDPAPNFHNTKAGFPFKDLEVGDSMHVPNDHPGLDTYNSSTTPKVVSAMYAYQNYQKKKNKLVKFVWDRLEDKSVKIYRIQ